MAHLLKYDSILGTYDGDVEVVGDGIKVDGDTLKILAERDPAALPWKELGRRRRGRVDRPVHRPGEGGASTSTRARRSSSSALRPRARTRTIVLGVNDDTLRPATGTRSISNASCTTNCVAPMAKVLDDAFGIEQGFMTTIHAYTNDQSILDVPHKDLREARAAAVNIIPTSTGAANATGLVLPKLKGKLDGLAMRVPVPDGSVTDLVAILGRDVTVEEVNAAFRAAVRVVRSRACSSTPRTRSCPPTSWARPASCTFDAPVTMAMGSLVKVVGWYDNEWGYSNRLVDLVEMVAASLW